MDSVACVKSVLKPHSIFFILSSSHIILVTSEVGICLLSANSGWKGGLCQKFMDRLEMEQNSRWGH